MKKNIEKYILIPLDFALLLAFVVFLIKGRWILALASLFISILVGFLGQSLHPKLTATDMAKGKHFDELFESKDL